MGTAPYVYSFFIPYFMKYIFNWFLIFELFQIKVEAKADISLEDESEQSVEITPIAETSKSNNTSAADEIDLNSDDGELFKEQLIDSTAKLELRTEPDDIFEDIPEIKESRNDSVNIPPVFEPAPRVQVKH